MNEEWNEKNRSSNVFSYVPLKLLSISIYYTVGTIHFSKKNYIFHE